MSTSTWYDHAPAPQRVAPSPPQLVVIANTLRVSIDWMLGRRKERGR